MRGPYRLALVAAAVGLGVVVWVVLAGLEPPAAALFVAAGAAPAAAVLFAWGRLRVHPFPGGALVGGAVVGPLVALVSHAFVGAFVAAFVLGFAESGRGLLEALRADPNITTALRSPWVLVLLVELVAVAPLTEEAGKVLGARLARPRSRAEAFLAGAAAGAGFGAVENVLYAALGATGAPWPAVVLGRTLGAAVHPLATGLVSLGLWEARAAGSARPLLRGYLAGVGIHALWNGSLVAVAVAETATRVGDVGGSLAVVSLVFSGALGAVMAAALWLACGAVASGRDPLPSRGAEARAVAGWIVLAASLLLPVVALILALPHFYLA